MGTRTQTETTKQEETWRLRVYGVVQGVGFRPTVVRHGTACGLGGTVCNKGPYVEIYAQGTPEQLARFRDRLERQPPRRAVILKIDTQPVDQPPQFSRFSILESEKTTGEIFLSPDIAICDDCKRELFDPCNRRYLHPFINCTCCGPRLTILDALPYDRERTSMEAFPMCPDCAREYQDRHSRRYDAQPVCCNQCGPEVYLLGRPERGRAAITAARQTILQGGIVAVKGIGGFHLCCDATNPAGVTLLRQRKHRPAKPFAVLVRDIDTARRECWVDAPREAVLTGHQKPILLLHRKPEGHICEAVAPGNPKVGVMLPYAPVQLLLFDYDDGLKMPNCLVMTSGNVSGAPICRDDREAEEELTPFTDCILSHNRAIRIRADDTVLDFFEGKPYMIRRSRGYAPLPLVNTGGVGQVLAIGGELKNTFCVASGELLYPSPYVGDLEDLRTVQALEETIQRFETLLEVRPQLVACDLHPRYHSTEVAREQNLPLLPVQHHYAHIRSCMAEHDWHQPVLGVAFDGTGYGSDGTVWGGELLRAEEGTFQRLGHITPFLQVGGDRAAREGWRIALTLLDQITQDREETLSLAETLQLCSRQTAHNLLTLADRKVNAVPSTSAGRLFDGVSALLGICLTSTFEGEAATALQFAAEAHRETGALLPELEELPLCQTTGEGVLELNTRGLVKALLPLRLAGVPAGALAELFHRTLARQITAACVRARIQTGLATVALSGGCFQNLLLLEWTVQGLRAQGFQVLTHSLIPPNDGGIALGQAAAALWYLRNRSEQSKSPSP